MCDEGTSWGGGGGGWDEPELEIVVVSNLKIKMTHQPLVVIDTSFCASGLVWKKDFSGEWINADAVK